jgi:glucosamine 6-phosphate synthetase-like amidotransferase/phosphosugar isomerase protein
MAEVRGRDASGFWVWRDDHYVFEKRPIPAEDLIGRSPRWKSLRFHPGSLYLLHTRAATEGDPNDNINNHPHIGKHSVMIHNGCIFNFEAIVRDQNIALGSDCDSEVLLRLAEAKDSVEDGLKHMFEVTHANTGTASIAVAVVDRRTPNRIFCTRNSGNPLYLVRSERFNCTFFVSTESIFEAALEMLYKTKDLKNVGGVFETVTPHHLYELSGEDGKWTSKHLVSLYQQSFHNNSFLDFEDEDTTLIKHYATGLLGGVPYSIDIHGSMNKMGEDEPEENLDDIEFLEDDKEGIGFTQAVEMSEEIEDDLRAYLQGKMREIEV